jgi:hypothetical protein
MEMKVSRLRARKEVKFPGEQMHSVPYFLSSPAAIIGGFRKVNSKLLAPTLE